MSNYPNAIVVLLIYDHTSSLNVVWQNRRAYVMFMERLYWASRVWQAIHSGSMYCFHRGGQWEILPLFTWYNAFYHACLNTISYLSICVVGSSSCKIPWQSHHSNVVASISAIFMFEQFWCWSMVVSIVWVCSQFWWLMHITVWVISTCFCRLTLQNQNQVDPRIPWLANYWLSSAICCKSNVCIWIYKHIKTKNMVSTCC